METEGLEKAGAAAADPNAADESPPDIEFSDHVMKLAFHPSAPMIAACSVSGYVGLFQYDVKGNKKLADINHHTQSCRALQFSADGNTLFSGATDACIGAFDVTAGRPSGILAQAHEAAICSLLVIEETMLASGDDDGVVKLWDLRQQRCVHELNEHEDFISDMVLADDNKTLLCAGGDGYLSVWNRRSGKLLAMSDQMEDEFLSLAIIKSGRKVVCGTQSGSLAIFSWGSWGDMSDRFVGHPQSVESLVKVDEDTVCTCSEDGIIRVISVHPNKLLGVIGEHAGQPVEHIAVSYDQEFMASCSHDNTVKFWGVGYLYQDDDDDEDEEGADSDEAGAATGDVEMDEDEDEAPKAKGKKGKKGLKSTNAAEDFYADM
eukprot:CAMPEP_0177708220 /NCGR_PEP_ID=MMETSP0484_2-20121128/10165_1 /TAXON_ID=354590 /ORGANISM="Rhodomonas lens, Strain RHODO" /LENGTH=375 /DNA_ID=CAMNT_0019219779 /DNA_START=11 /DNA_END=1138 /DNA_ORIENTATION=-